MGKMPCEKLILIKLVIGWINKSSNSMVKNAGRGSWGLVLQGDVFITLATVSQVTDSKWDSLYGVWTSEKYGLFEHMVKPDLMRSILPVKNLQNWSARARLSVWCDNTRDDVLCKVSTNAFHSFTWIMKVLLNSISEEFTFWIVS